MRRILPIARSHARRTDRQRRSLRALRPADFADDRTGIPTRLGHPFRTGSPVRRSATGVHGDVPGEKVADLKVGIVLEES